MFRSGVHFGSCEQVAPLGSSLQFRRTITAGDFFRSCFAAHMIGSVRPSNPALLDRSAQTLFLTNLLESEACMHTSGL